MLDFIIVKSKANFKLYFVSLLGFFLCVLLSQTVGAKSKKTKRRRDKQTVGDVIRKIESKQSRLKLQKQISNFPTMSSDAPVRKVNLQQIKPPSVRKKQIQTTDQPLAEIENLTDQSIKQMYLLVQRSKNSRRRGELWLRLAELYSEKAKYVSFRLESEYEKKISETKSGHKPPPRPNMRIVNKYNSKAIQLYEWFIRDYPKDPKMDQALFFLGYNYFELGQVKKGESFYERLSVEYPKSPFVDESNFALGEYYFENEKWPEALSKYQLVSRKKRSSLFGFATYKEAWCQYKLGRLSDAIKSMETVVLSSRMESSGMEKSARKSSLIQMGKEATNDLIVFYAEAGQFESAKNYFRRVVGKEELPNVLEKLAYHYLDRGRREASSYLFKELIRQKPNAPKAYNYQYQIVNMYLSAGSEKIFWKELTLWIDRYGPKSRWYKLNEKDKPLVEKSEQLIETTLRNFTLRQHKTAQTNRAQHSQQMAKMGYDLYFDTFKETPQMDEMHFFYGELLFDMNQYAKAAYHYLWVSDHAKESKYLKRSVLNALLALEKNLPTSVEMEKIVGESTTPLEFDRSIKAFEKTAQIFFEKFPDSPNIVAIKYRLGTLHYYYNHYDTATGYFFSIIKDHPKSTYVNQSAEAVLDIYNMRKDFEGLSKSADTILAIPSIANSKLGDRIRTIKQKTQFKLASNMEKDKNFQESAQAYMDFAEKNKGSDLAFSALFNAALNFEKANNYTVAMDLYKKVLDEKPNNEKEADLWKRSRRFLGLLYEKTGQYPMAASEFEKYAGLYKKDKESSDLYYNAGVIREGLRHFRASAENYIKYMDLSRAPDRYEVYFNLAQMNLEQGRITAAIQDFNNYINKSGRDPEKTVEAVYKIAELTEKKSGLNAALSSYERTLKVQRNLSHKDKRLGSSFAAMAKFKFIYKSFQELIQLRFPKSPKGQARVLQEMTRLRQKIERDLKILVSYDYGPMIVAALTLQGQTLNHISNSILQAPLPAQINTSELKKQYLEGLKSQVEPIQKDAIEAFRTAIKRVNSLLGYGPWVEVAHKELGKVDPNENPYFPLRVYQTKHLDWLGM